MKKLLLSFLIVYSAARVNAQACTGAPAANTALASATNICVGTSVTLSLQNPYTATGIVYQWAYSTATSSGPWTAIGGANAANLVTTTLSQMAWYTCVIGCSNSLMTTTATPVYINVNATGASTTVPYFENFENPVANGLPTCDWTASSLGVNCISFPSAVPPAIPNSGFRMLGFSYSTTALGPHEFYSLGINLFSGVTYSVNLAQSTNNYSGFSNWSQFGIGVGAAQAATGGTVVYSTNNPNTGPYTQRSATFSVPSNGVYYLRIFATSITGTINAPYLTFDNLSVTAPCTVGNNGGSALITSTSNITPNGLSLCQGDSALVNFSPAANCVMVAPTSNTAYISTSNPQFPTGTSFYTYVVTNTLTGCTNTNTLILNVSPAPNVFLVNYPPVICKGSSTSIQAYGASNYTLMPGALVGNTFSVAPTVTTVYTITGFNQFSCGRNATITILVNPNPQITLGDDTLQACAGESPNIAVTGANGYTCSYQGAINGTSLITLPQVSSSGAISVTGANSNQCTDTKSFYLKVDACAGLSQLNGADQLRVYPNPAHNVLFIQHVEAAEVKMYNLQGQLALQQQLLKGTSALDISKLASGIYYLKIVGETSTQELRVVKEN